MEFLKEFAIIVGLPSSIGYFIAAMSYKDPLFFIRTSSFKRKVRKQGFENIVEFLHSLLETTKEDWRLEGDDFVYTPFLNTKIVFSGWALYQFDIFEGKAEKKVFGMLYYSDSENLGGVHDPMTKKSPNEEERFLLVQMMLYLKSLYREVLTEKREEEKEHWQNRQNVLNREKERKKEKLRSFLIQDAFVDDLFSIRYENKPGFQSLALSMYGTVYFQAIKLHNGSELSAIIHNKENEEAKVFMELKEELTAFAQQSFEKKSFAVI